MRVDRITLKNFSTKCCPETHEKDEGRDSSVNYKRSLFLLQTLPMKMMVKTASVDGIRSPYVVI